MKFEFANKHLEKLCEKENYAVKKLGKACAQKLFARMADIRAATKVAELIVGDPHQFTSQTESAPAVSSATGNGNNKGREYGKNPAFYHCFHIPPL